MSDVFEGGNAYEQLERLVASSLPRMILPARIVSPPSMSMHSSAAAIDATMLDRAASQSLEPSSVHNAAGHTFGLEDDEDNHKDDQFDHELAVDRSATLIKAPSKKRSNVTSETELKALFARNIGRSLEELAAEIHRADPGKTSERPRQAFAMNW